MQRLLAGFFRSIRKTLVCRHPADTPPFALYEERIMAGLEAAKKRGKRGGRPHAISEETMVAIRQALPDGASKAAVCRTFGVKRSTLYDALARVGAAHHDEASRGRVA